MKKIKTTKIGQKDYVDVSERIKHFWELHADWSIHTTIEQVDLESGVVIIKAWVEDETSRVRSTGHAHEFQADKKSRVNMTSFVENCETSAIGRALGTLGIGTEHGIASAFEVQLAKEKEAEMNQVMDIVTDAAKKKVEDEKSGVDIASDYASSTLTQDATPEQLESITGKKVKQTEIDELEQTLKSENFERPKGKEDPEHLEFVKMSANAEKEQEYLVDLNKRVSMCKSEADAKALAKEGREWTKDWSYKKEEYGTLYKCITESFSAFKKSQDAAKAAASKGGA